MAGFSEFTIGGASDNTLPVEMAGFTGQARKLSILLEWITAVEIANSGFEIQRLSESELLSVWTTVGHVDGAGSSSVPHRYSFTDCVPAGGRYAYRLKQINNDGAVKYSSQIEVEAGLMSRELKLFPNYPNPFNPATTLEFVVPEDGWAVVAVYNAVGQLVAELFRENIRAGWIQQVRFDASSLPSGTYFVQLTAGGHTTMKKVLFLK
jgi:hypothetical protein